MIADKVEEVTFRAFEVLAMDYAHGRSIHIYLIDDAAEGRRLTEISGWTGCCLDFPRASYVQARKREEFGRAGVYILTGPNEVGTADDTGAQERRVYVGESTELRIRLDDHQRTKEFWTRAFIFTAKDQSLNKGHILYLEARLLRLAREVGTAAIENDRNPDLKHVREQEKADMERFLAEILLLLPVLGVSDFQVVRNEIPSHSAGTDAAAGKRYSLKDATAKAEMLDTASGFLVLAGAEGPITEKTMTPSYESLRQRLKSSGVLKKEGEKMVLVKDYVFKSPSAAASVITGASRSGNLYWLDSNNKTLGEWRKDTTGEPVNEESTPAVGETVTEVPGNSSAPGSDLE
ncbi:GIY-YIG nuclease family protein [Actinoplanes sp. CA-252034]|uniref:GIY-YIG nuclease family protein n=1 Tax=Actinoplanes sp. CA-252034 TaxID=3239906 RepID=UPI003D954690